MIRLRPGEVSRNVLAPGRIRRIMPNLFGSRGSIVPEEPRRLMGLGGVEDYKADSSATIKSKIIGFNQQLINATAERDRCQVGVTTILLPWELAAHAECVLRGDGQIGWFKDRISEATVALGLAQRNEKAAKDQADAEAQLLAAEVATGSAAMVGGKAKGSKGKATIPTWAKAVGGVVLLGSLTFVLVRKGK